MTLAEEVSRWLDAAGADAGRALVAAGLDDAEIQRRDAAAGVTSERGQMPSAPTISWNLDSAGWRRIIDGQSAGQLAGRLPGQLPTILRVGVPAGSPVPVLERLMQSSDIGSAFVEVVRPKGALRRRPWRWPLRLATLGADEADVESLRSDILGRHNFPPQLLDIRRSEVEPGAVDLLLLRGPLDSAAAAVDAKDGPVANGVIVAGVDHRWTHSKKSVDTIRSWTGAVVVALYPGDDLGAVVDRLITEMSHSLPFDVALTNATSRSALLIAERAGLDRAQLPLVARRMAEQIALARERMTSAEPPGDEAAPMFLPDVDTELVEIADGGFHHEHAEATAVAAADEVITTEMEIAASRERWLQASLGEVTDPEYSQILKRGANQLNVFIGTLVEHAAAAPRPFVETDLPWDDEDAEAFRLTIGFVPLQPRGRAQTAELELPRVGSSEPVTFRWNVRRERGSPEPLTRASARILVMFRNRVLQTAVVTGTFDAPIALEEAVALRPDLGGLDDRQPFDVAFFANHDDRNVPALIRASKGHLQFDAMAGLDGVVTQLANILGSTVTMTQNKQGLKSDRARKLLIELAGKGRDLYQMLEQLGSLEKAKRIQIVSARSSWFLPIELAYRRWAPNADATVCTGFLGGNTKCDGDCPKDNDRTVVCPNAFWGLDKVIERIAFDPVLHADLNGKFLVLVAPRANDRRLSVGAAAIGASTRVRPVDVTELIDALGQGSVHAKGWPDWTTAIANADLDLLVLLPHTEYGPTQSFMEIGKTKLERGHMETDVVRRSDSLKPAVILFGCRTTGTADDATGFATRFMQNGAALVFSSLTLLLGRHAATLSRRLSADLRAAKDANRPVAEVLTNFRRAAVKDGLLAALAVTAYGDADWTL